MFAALHETDDSTAINLTAYGNFIPGSGNQLLTVGRKYLRFFRTNPYALVTSDDGGEEFSQKTKLECIFSVRLLSSVQDLAVAKIPLFPSADCLLLAFDDAKVSIVGISPTERNLQTISLHSFEDDTLKDGFTRNCSPPIIRGDPSSRCGAMLVYGKHIAVLPFLEGVSHVHSYTVKLTNIDPRLENILDMTFLHGYFEPTLLFLYEPLQTTAGRASIRADTCCIMGVSLNTRERQQAVVWQMSGLPMDCYRLQAIHSPLGGAMVFGANEIIYLNQSVPPCGVSLNSCLESFTKFPLKDMTHLSLVLDASESAYLTTGKVAVGTRDGQLYLITLETDSSSNAVKNMNIELATECTIPCTMMTCASGHLFIGSRLGDSQLLHFDIKQEEVALETDEGEGPSSKKAHLDDEMDEEDRLLYGDDDEDESGKKDVEVKVTRTIDTWTWNELDRLPNIGPVMSITAGGANSLSGCFDATTKADPIFDLVTASGRGKEGALCVMQRTIRPQVLSSSGIDGAEQLWAVGVREDGSHRYLIITRERSTIVLELLEEMVELEQPVFIVDEQTISAGELADGAIAVQVTSMSVCLVGGDAEQLQCFEVNSNFPVIAACIVDPYVAVLTENGKLILYQLETQPQVHLKELDLSTTQLGMANLTAMSLYRDMSGLMIRESLGGGGRRKKREERLRREIKKTTHMEDTKHEEEDLEDLLLYGESSNKKMKKKEEEYASSILARKRRRVMIAASAIGGEESDAMDPNMMVPTHWITVARSDGKIAIFELPSMSLVYQVRRFYALPEVLVDTTMDDEKERKDHLSTATKEDESDESSLQRPEEKVVEITLTGMGINQSRPVLFAVLDDLVVAYELFSADNDNDGHLAIRFRRLPLTRPVRESAFIGADGKRTTVECAVDEARTRGPVVQPFERVGSVMNSVFIRGPYPSLVMMTSFAGFRVHPITIDGPIRSFTPFNNENVAAGFLYLTEKDREMRVAKLPAHVNLEMSCPMRKVPIEKTVHFVRYCMQRQVYVVVTSRSARSNRICTLANDEKVLEALSRPDSFVCPTIDEYSVDLFSDEDWQAVPNTGFMLQEMEVATGCEEVLLRSESTISGLQNYVAIGTINNYGEEVLIRGRIILIEIIEVVPEPGQPTSKHKMKVLYDKEQKGPVTSLCCCDGFLLTGMGQKIFIWQYRDGDLQGVSFLDLHYYIHSLCSIRSLTLACDVFASMSLIRFQDKFKALSVASRDDRVDATPPLTSAFIVDNDHLGFLLSDEEGNLSVFNYLPREGVSGDRLSLRGAICVGTSVNAMMRVKGHTSSLPSGCTMEQTEASAQQSTVWSSLDGSMGYVRSLGEKQFRRLQCLQQSMASVVPQLCGLNPRGSRSARPARPTLLGESNRNIVDVDIVGQFMHLSTADKQELARKLGGNRYQMMDDLIMLERLSTFF